MRGVAFCVRLAGVVLLLCAITNVHAVVRYVALDGANVAPYTTWASAATSIQSAVDVATAGDEIRVSNGTYNISAEIFVNKAVIITSIAGAVATTIKGNWNCRGFLLDSVNCVISGFTVTNCRSSADGGAFFVNNYSYLPQICDCIIIGNRADWSGGATWCGTFRRCQIIHNSSGWTGVARGPIMFDCLLANNTCDGNDVGGLAGGAAINCTVFSNSYGGVTGAMCSNTIIYGNVGYQYTNLYAQSVLRWSCATPLAPGPGNIAADPRFMDATKGDFRLRGDSPCINAGTNMPWMIGATDLAGQPRIIGNRVDMGAYETGGGLLVITAAPATVVYTTSSASIAGTNHACIGLLWASNVANAQVYSFPAAHEWTSPEIVLEVGLNSIVVSGTDTFGLLAIATTNVTRKAATPTGVTASDGTFTGKVALAWLAAPGAVSYRILRAETNDSSAATTIANAVSNTVYDDTTATPGLLYYYWLIAQQNGVEGDPSSSDSGYRQLQASASIKATLGERTNSVRITWAPVAGATKYRVYRADSTLTNLAALLSGDIADTNYTDMTVTPGLVYYYWVQAQSAVAVSAWSGTTPGYALLAANFADKKMWSMRDTKKYDTLTCKQLPGPWSELFDAGWSIGIANALTHEIVNGPFELVTKNGRVWTLKSPATTITYTQRYNKRKDTYKVKLVYKFLGNMPTKPGFYLHPPAGN